MNGAPNSGGTIPGSAGRRALWPPHALPASDVLQALDASVHGLSAAEARARLARVGPNALPRARPPSIARVFLRQFVSPLIYVLLAAAATSLAVGHATDAAFILAVLLINAVIGTAQEYAAQRSAEALRSLIAARARVVRDGVDLDVDAEALVPGDVVRLEGGFRVPADMRILAAVGLDADESLLTGESVPVAKRAEPPASPDTPVPARAPMLFAGSLVSRGRATGVVVETGLRTELGKIATAVIGAPAAQPPLLVRMEKFSRKIAIAVAVTATALGAVSLARGAPLADVFLMAVALAVSAIPEGLPVALTVALAIGARRMARHSVIARRLVAVEALGSCTYVASDKTGTLTLNELTVRTILLPGERRWEVTGSGLDATGGVLAPPRGSRRIEDLCTAGALCNDGYFARVGGRWEHHGDAVDVALLVLARKIGVSRPDAEVTRPRVAEIPYESERGFAATLHGGPAGLEVFVKGAVERILPMCSSMAAPAGERPLDAIGVERGAEQLAACGFRVLAIARGLVVLAPGQRFGPGALRGLVLLGLVGMIDPLRPDAAASVRACRDAGIEVAMVTGDHPVTALAISRELGLAEGADEVVSGTRLTDAARDGSSTFDAVVGGARVFARADPSQKLEIVRSLRRLGHFVAVTGDGANDAPALRAAHIGVAMGRRGTDVARESAEIVLADDNFSSIVAGVEEGRIAYANIRKVIFLLVSTGAAEIVLFTLAVATGLPLPLFAPQLLWLNLVTNGVQDVALTFEPAEGGEMSKPPRPPREAIFDGVMITRTATSAAVMGTLTFAAFVAGLRMGWDVDRVRNGVLLMMVLLENVQAGNSRSETLPILRLSPLRNPVLLFGTLGALGLHVAAMYLPPLSGPLRTRPAGALEWFVCVMAALLLAGAVDLEKWARRTRARRQRKRT